MVSKILSAEIQERQIASIEGEEFQQFLSDSYAGRQINDLFQKVVLICDKAAAIGFEEFLILKENFPIDYLKEFKSQFAAEEAVRIMELATYLFFVSDENQKKHIINSFKSHSFKEICAPGVLTNLEKFYAEISLFNKNLLDFLAHAKSMVIEQICLELLKKRVFEYELSRYISMEIHDVQSLKNAVAEEFGLIKRGRERDFFAAEIDDESAELLSDAIIARFNEKEVLDFALQKILKNVPSDLSKINEWLEILEIPGAVNLLAEMKNLEPVCLKHNFEEILLNLIKMHLHEIGLVILDFPELTKRKLLLEGSVDAESNQAVTEENLGKATQEIWEYVLMNRLKLDAEDFGGVSDPFEFRPNAEMTKKFFEKDLKIKGKKSWVVFPEKLAGKRNLRALFTQSVIDGDLEELQLILQRKPEFLEKAFVIKLVFDEILNGKFAAVDFLISYEKFRKNIYVLTLLSIDVFKMVIDSGKFEMLKWLISAGTYPSWKHNFNCSPLRVALYLDSQAAVRICAEHAVPFLKTDRDFIEFIADPYSFGAPLSAKILFDFVPKNPAIINEIFKKLLNEASVAVQKSFVSVVFSKMGGISENLLVYAIQCKNVQIVKKILQIYPAVLENASFRVLYIAAVSSLEICDLILRKHAWSSADFANMSNLLIQMLRAEKFEYVELLIRADREGAALFSQQGQSVIKYVISNHLYGVLDLILKLHSGSKFFEFFIEKESVHPLVFALESHAQSWFGNNFRVIKSWNAWKVVNLLTRSEFSETKWQKCDEKRLDDLISYVIFLKSNHIIKIFGDFFLNGKNVCERDEEGKKPVDYAAENENWRRVRLFLELERISELEEKKECGRDFNGKKEIDYAAERSDWANVKRILDLEKMPGLGKTHVQRLGEKTSVNAGLGCH